MKIGIIGAMEQEVTLLKDKINNSSLQTIAGCKFYTGNMNGIDIVLLQSGIGKVAAALGTSVLLDRFKATVVISTGSAGGFDSTLNPGNIVIATNVAYHDADVTAFGHAMGQMAGQPITFMSDEKLMSIAEQALATMNPAPHVMRGLICTGDVFVHTAERQHFIRRNFPNVIAVEMEAAAIAQACYQFNVPFVIVRAISDVVDKEAPMMFEEFLPLAVANSSSMIKKMVELFSA
ncbi:5'-methylthioadenosine/S-adenosylhomocysteine nucleosidase [Candidatus Enterovibrio altilux]|uniref:5'-methylthioadenosine/S-adenosylhomocysteine nucleosidase n=1 Tax=Candidatus Enterovibrio altilux TaxID=1927128 RepID=A0A291BAN5_9GAMM|nr:5'-methylthioadenosine/S-adenosylhomocysteine nucleosidase [Candidatus Enterovibrio luxaltus]ATF10053.1 5'-methylthioadenosine nucleosidase [Candidatus Enterovibrio luxaltus]